MNSRASSQEPMDFSDVKKGGLDFYYETGKSSLPQLIKEAKETLTHLSRIRQNSQDSELERLNLLRRLLTQLESASLNPTIATDKAKGSSSSGADTIPVSVQQAMESLNMKSFDPESMGNALRYLLQQAQSDIGEASKKRSDVDNVALAKLTEIIWESVDAEPKPLTQHGPKW
ncbi:hypothetical protein N7493_002434 [Penicillium malachiteum]|uniref:Uncharacterized protein n=1 Tax=Penicillium malachiteum TaxID=1324776 RepID=A0AAD6MYL4_9EURO|nr:hypothetical protein N7493_002434 [Penicillium malachiteum]